MTLRWMIRRDLPEVLNIESHSFEVPWSEDDFMSMLRRRNTIGMVYENESDAILAYAIYSLNKTSLEINSMAVHKDHRRQGIGTQIIDKLIQKISFGRRDAVTLVVRERNLQAQLFFKHNGFRWEQTIREYYEVPEGTSKYEDAYQMTIKTKSPATSFSSSNI